MAKKIYQFRVAVGDFFPEGSTVLRIGNAYYPTAKELVSLAWGKHEDETVADGRLVPLEDDYRTHPMYAQVCEYRKQRLAYEEAQLEEARKIIARRERIVAYLREDAETPL